MTDRISILALRKQAEGPFDGIVYLDARVSLALVEAVEAAEWLREEIAVRVHNEIPPSTATLEHWLLRVSSLARFDFGEEA